MATELTVKERAFARLIIEGTKVAAYRKVYSDRGSPATQIVNAYKLSKKPKIKAEVARLLRQQEFSGDDYARIRDVAVAGLTEIFLQELDPRLRVKAGTVLLAYADAGLKLHPVPSTKEVEYDQLVAWIHEQVSKERNAPLIPARATDQSIPIEITHGLAAAIVAEECKDAGENLKEADSVESVTVQSSTPLQPVGTPAPGYRKVAIPGRHPPKYRWIPLAQK